MNQPADAFLRRRALVGMALAWSLLPGTALSAAFDDYFQAVKKDDAKKVGALLQRGFDPNAIEPERGDSGMILALREDAMKVFRILLQARDIDLELAARNGDTALMIAAYKGNLPAVEALLEGQAEVNRPGWTALHYASAVGHDGIVQRLLDRSAYIDAASPNGTTPLMMAARGGHILTVKLLLDEGADAALANAAGMTAIDFAKKSNHTHIADGLAHRLQKARKP